VHRDSVSEDYGWCSDSDVNNSNHTEWVKFDMGMSQKVSRVDLYPRNDSGGVGKGFPIDFTIQVSDDDVNWTTVVTKTGYPQPGNSAQGFPFAEQTARYIKVTGTKLPLVGATYRMQFAEIEAYGGNMAAHKNVSASSSMELGELGWGAQAATDGITATSYNSSYGWSSNSNVNADHSEWVTVDLGGNSLISHVDLYPRNESAAETGYGFPVDFTIKTSTDNANWTTVATRTNYARPGDQAQSFSFATRTARYVKIEGTKLRPNPNSNNTYRMQFAEIKAY
jgi:hypothetical protein